MFKMVYVTLLSGVLIFFVITVYSAENDTLKLINNIRPQQYNIKLKLYVEENIFFSECDINIKILKATDQISMFAEKLSIMHATLINNVGYNQKEINYKVVGNMYDPEKNIISLYFKNKLTPGLYVLSMKFSNYFKEGFPQIYFSPSSERGVMWLIATHFQPTWAERIFPCWNKHKENANWLDLPVFTFSIEHSKKYSVLTNMRIEKEEVHEDDIKWTHFYTTPRMSPYVTSIVVTDFALILIDKDDVLSMWCKNQSASSLQFALTIARNITTYLFWSKEWQRWKFPMRVNLIVIPDVSEAKFLERNDSLVHSGIIITKETNIIYNEENDSVGHKYNVIRLLGYKVMQEYYEWIVNPFWEPSTWLSKGFATFTATHILNLTFPNLRMIDLFVVQIQHECLDFDVDNRMLPFPHKNKIIPAQIIGNIKASIIFRMLRHAFISEAFWKAIETFTYDSSLRNKEHHLEIFWKALKDAHDKIDPKMYDIKSMMHPWVEQKGYPVLTVIRNYDTSAGVMNVSIENLDIPKDVRAIPVSYTTRRDLNFHQTRPQVWLFPPYNPSGHFKILNLNYREESWVIFNIQQTGYYRVNYDDENWARISRYLNKGDYWKIHVLNRAQLIDDAFQFMLLGKLKADIFWQLTKYLERETDYIAWYPMFKAIEYMSNGFVFFKKQPIIRNFLGEMLHTLLGNIEYEEQLTDRDFTKALRQEAVRLTCCLNLFDCAGSAFILLKQHLETNTKLSLWWKKWTYCYGLIAANNITWHQTLNKIKGNDNDKTLYLVTCPNHLVKINNYTSITDTNDDTKSRITPSTKVQFELRHFVYTIVESVKNDEEYNNENDHKTYKDNKIFKNLLDNFADIKPRQLKWSAALLILINNIYSIEHLNKVDIAFRNFESNLYKIQKKLEARQVQVDNHMLTFKRYI